jgi:hypothetical protein
MSYTREQYESLGRLVAMHCDRTGHRARIVVQPEIAGNALIAIVEHNEPEAPHRIVFGIEPDGYCHT